MKIYTRHGDDGTTGLLYGGRVAKDDPGPAAYGDVDEAQAAIGTARAAARATHETDAIELDELLVGLERDLWVAMAELATAPDNRTKLQAGSTLVTAEMVTRLEQVIDDITARFDQPTEFVVPGQNPIAAALDVARTVVRRAERTTISSLRDLAIPATDTHAVAYLNRLSDLLWTLARWQDGVSLPSRQR